MLAYTYIEKGKFALVEKPKPTLIEPTDAIVRVTMSSICTSDLHIKHGSVPRAVPGITVGHEMVGVVEEVGSEVKHVKPGDLAITMGCGDINRLNDQIERHEKENGGNFVTDKKDNNQDEAEAEAAEKADENGQLAGA